MRGQDQCDVHECFGRVTVTLRDLVTGADEFGSAARGMDLCTYHEERSSYLSWAMTPDGDRLLFNRAEYEMDAARRSF